MFSNALFCKKIKANPLIFFEYEWWFSVIDVIGLLSDSDEPRKYWTWMKAREADVDRIELSTFSRQFKLTAPDGKNRETDWVNLFEPYIGHA